MTKPRKPTQAEYAARYLRQSSPYTRPLFPASDVTAPLRMVMGKWVRDTRNWSRP